MTSLVLDRGEIDRTLRRIAAEIVEATSARGVPSPLGLVGIRRGGVPLARRLAELVGSDREAPVGTIDITLYRDDAATALYDPKIGPSEIAFEVEGRDIVLVDDVLQTGRTVRAAIDCLLDYGRPRRVWLAVLADRGGRELPVAPDFTGKTLAIDPSERLELEATDDSIEALVQKPRRSA
jgi:pyrimidine operon attenuation protein / uracil phosphoribosyltransferase